MRIPYLVTLAASIGLTLTLNADTSQIRVPRLPRNIPKEIPRLDRLPSLDDLLNRAPLSSSLADAVTEVPFLDRFDPAGGAPLLELPFGFDNGVTLVPGLWLGEIQSYCLKAGTYGPTRGDGYLWAPLKGPKAGVIQAILNRSALRPDLPQRDIQVLLWGIIARSPVSNLDAGPRRVAQALLDESELASIDTSALDVIPDDWMRKVTGPLDGAVRRVLEAENRIREVLRNPAGAAYEELERIAVLNGVPPPSRERLVPRGRWSWHPDGYFVRYMPESYSNTKLQIYSPERFTTRRGTGGQLSELRDAAGTTLRIESENGGAVRGSLDVPGGTPKAVTFRSSDDSASAGKAALSGMTRLGVADETSPRARDLQDVAALASATDDPDVVAFLHRALASTAGEWADTSTKAAAAAADARFRVASRTTLLLPPSLPSLETPMMRPGAGGGGGGAGMPGGGRQRIGPSLRPYGNNPADRARQATNAMQKIPPFPGGPAAGLGFAIPRFLFGKILDFNFDTWGRASDALGGNSGGDAPLPIEAPDVASYSASTAGRYGRPIAFRGASVMQTYREIARPAEPELAVIEPEGELTTARAERGNALLRELATANTHLAAAKIALDRHAAAVKAGDREWAGRQAQALVYLKRQAGLHSLRAADHLEELSKDRENRDSWNTIVEAWRAVGANYAALPAVTAPW